MRKLLTIGLVLAIVAGTSFGLEVGGSTSAAYAGNADEKMIMIDHCILTLMEVLISCYRRMNGHGIMR